MFGRGRKQRRDSPDPAPGRVPDGVAGTPFTAATLSGLDETARFEVHAGYRSTQEIRDLLVERVEHDPETEAAFAADRDLSLRAVDELLDRHVAEHAATAQDFPTPTDPERLTAVLDGLRDSGILAGENRGYTQSDLSGEMWDELREHPQARGWTGFHEQDLDRAMHTGLLYLSFAHRSDLDADFALIAGEVADALRAAGFDVGWDGDPDARIEVRGIRWQRRRPA